MHSPSAPAVLATLPWRSAWPVGEGVASDAGGSGRLLDAGGSAVADPGPACGELRRFDGQGALWLPSGEPISFTKAAAVPAALVERAAWRLSEVGSEGTAVLPGVEAPDPAIHRGVRVRSLRKIRRQGPPYQVVLGERGSQVLVALTDRDASIRHDGLALQRSGSEPQVLGIVPAVDLDGDQDPEITVHGDGEAGGFRAVISVDLVRGTLTLRSFEERGTVSCPGE